MTDQDGKPPNHNRMSMSAKKSLSFPGAAVYRPILEDCDMARREFQDPSLAFGQPFDYPKSGWAFSEELHCIGVSKAGQPLHPLARGKMRVPDSALPFPWRRP